MMHAGKLLGHEGAVLSMVLDEDNERLYTASVDQASVKEGEV